MIFGGAFFVSESLLGIGSQIQFWQESLGAMLEYRYIKCGLLIILSISVNLAKGWLLNGKIPATSHYDT